MAERSTEWQLVDGGYEAEAEADDDLETEVATP